jgi:hypothetical protein
MAGGRAEPTKYWPSTLPEDMLLDVLVDVIKLRWRIEREDEELKSEMGLAHFEGRGWRGFHHHASLCIAAYGFLIIERSVFPLSARWRREKPSLAGRSPSPRERHVATSVTMVRKKLTIALAKSLQRCPCGQVKPPQRD